ncbi:universal stress protein UspA [Cutibacterium acnes JCM 18909]|nr:universal stress protein UspA [Cutibacterium acnes JCM 18909]
MSDYPEADWELVYLSGLPDQQLAHLATPSTLDVSSLVPVGLGSALEFRSGWTARLPCSWDVVSCGRSSSRRFEARIGNTHSARDDSRIAGRCSSPSHRTFRISDGLAAVLT